MNLSRRDFAIGGLTSAGASLLPLSFADRAAAQEARLRFLWWGGENRAQRTLAAVERYIALNPDITIDPESIGWDSYWQRLATQVAGGNPPDVVQMDFQFIFEYARRGALLPLNEYLPDPLNISDFGEQTLNAGTVDGQLFGVTFGVNCDCTLYNQTALEELGLPPPSLTWTWDEYADLATEITNATPEGVYGSTDVGGTRWSQTFIRQRGYELYSEGGLGCSLEDIADWLGFIDDLRKKGGIVPPDVQATDPGESITESMLTRGISVIAGAGSNQLVAYQGVNENKLGMTMHPHGGSQPGQWIGPSMLLSITPSAADKYECARFINFLVESPEAADELGVERGVPPSAAMRDYLGSKLSEVELVAVRFVSDITDKVGPLPPPPPAGAGEAQALLIRTNQRIAFGEASVSDAARDFYTEANDILARG